MPPRAAVLKAPSLNSRPHFPHSHWLTTYTRTIVVDRLRIPLATDRISDIEPDSDDGPGSSCKSRQLDVQVLTCVLKHHSSPQQRLTLAVLWDRLDLVQRLVVGGNEPDEATALALQRALELGRVAHVRSLVLADPFVCKSIDFISLYQADNALSDSALRAGLTSRHAINAVGSPTNRKAFERVLLPALAVYVPGLEERMACLERPSVSDMLTWAVLGGNLALSRGLWQLASKEDGDPIRLALLAAKSSSLVADSPRSSGSGGGVGIAARHFAANAVEFERWAVEVLDCCKLERDAAQVLLRRSGDHWPNSVLRLAVDGGNMRFTGHPLVQNLVSEAWRGSYVGSSWALPRHTSTLQLALHFFMPLEMESVSLEDIAGVVYGSKAGADASSWSTVARQAEHSPANPAAAVHRSPLTASLLQSLTVRRQYLGFLATPRVQYLLMLSSYMFYLCVYYAVLYQHGGKPQVGFSKTEVVFYLWTLTLLAAEVFQYLVCCSRMGVLGP